MSTKGIPQIEGGLTQSEIALLLGIPRDRVKYIEQQAMRKLRKAAEQEGISFDFGYDSDFTRQR